MKGYQLPQSKSSNENLGDIKIGVKRSFEEMDQNNGTFNNANSAEKKKGKQEGAITSTFPFPKKEKIILSKSSPSPNIINEKFSEFLKEYPDKLRKNFEKTLKELISEGYSV